MATDQASPPPPDSQTSDAETATALAQQVAASADGVTWRKTTTLLDLFGAYRLTSEVRDRIGAALEGAGLIAKPAIDELQRFETVRLAIEDESDEQLDESRGRSRTMSRLLPIDEVVEVSEWRPGQPREQKTLFQCVP